MDLIPANEAHWHLVLNHLPVVGSLAVLLLMAWAFIKNSDESKRIALTALVLVGLSALPAFLTGEPAEQHLKGLPGISKRWMSAHEEAAEVATWVTFGAGVVGLGALVVFRKTRKIPRWVVGVLLLATVICWALMTRAANFGGKIHHPEILKGAEPAPTEIEH